MLRVAHEVVGTAAVEQEEGCAEIAAAEGHPQAVGDSTAAGSRIGAAAEPGRSLRCLSHCILNLNYRLCSPCCCWL